MKKTLICFLFALFTAVVGSFSHADTINLNWLNEDGTVNQTTTCEPGGDIILPNSPTKFGYTFVGWRSYTPIEYIESTGTQYIDTNILVDATVFRILADFIPVINTTSDPSSVFLGTVESSSVDAFIVSGGKGIALGADANCIYNYSSSLNGKEIVYDGTFSTASPRRSLVGTINGVAFSKQTDVSPIVTSGIEKHVRIFGHGDNYRSKIKLKYIKIYKNNNLVLDMIPMLDGAGVACMYDKVEGKFYYNDGTGDFTAGPVIYQQ